MRPSGAPFLGEKMRFLRWTHGGLLISVSSRNNKQSSHIFGGQQTVEIFRLILKLACFSVDPKKRRNYDEKQLQVHSPWPYWRVQSQNHLRFAWKTVVGEKNNGLMVSFIPWYNPSKKWQKKKTNTSKPQRDCFIDIKYSNQPAIMITL